MKVYFLGTMGYHPKKDQNTACYLVEYKNRLIMLDAGTGVCNLVMYGHILEKYNDIEIILSHYHQDHIVGLFYLNNYLEDKNISIYAPGEPYYSPVSEILSNLTNENFSTRSINNMGRNMKIIDYDLSGFKIGDINIYINLQEHTNHSFGINIDNKLHYATDTIADIKTFNLALNSKLLLHECWSLVKNNDKHSSLEEILRLNNILRMEKIYLIHKNPDWTKNELIEIEGLIENQNIYMARDGDEIILE